MDDFKLEACSDPDRVERIAKVPEIHTVPAKPAIQGIVIAETLFKLPTHYDGHFTRLCLGEGKCELCGKVECRIFFLVGILDKYDNVKKWIKVSYPAGTSLLRQIKEAQRTIYGASVKIGRERPVANAPIFCHFDPWSTVQGRLPAPIDPMESVRRCFFSPKSYRQPEENEL